MNFYNPYYNFPYTSTLSSQGGIFSRLLGGVKGIKWGSVVTNIQKTLGLVNQAIPVIKQVNPMIKNAKTMFKVMSEFNKVDSKKDSSATSESSNSTTATKKVSDEKPTETITEKITPITQKTSDTNEGGPTFFL